MKKRRNTLKCEVDMLENTVETDKKEKEEQVPLFSIGLIADPQYADADDGQNYTKTRTRRYRQSLTLTQNAVKTWNDASECLIRPSLMICLGDVIDLCNVENKTSVQAMNNMMIEFSKFKPFNSKQLLQAMHIKENEENKENKEEEKDNIIKYPFYHNCIGNHELYNFDRKELRNYQFCPNYNQEHDEYEYYYSFYPYHGFLFIILDAFVISIHGYQYCQNKHKYFNMATDLLHKHNPFQNKNIPPTATNKTEFDVQRYSAFNGGFGIKQLKWLSNQLEIAKTKKDKVFIFSHVPLISTNQKSPYEILAWDYKQCKLIIDKYSEIVKIYFAGHDHDGDKKINGIIHRTFEGVIESDEETNCFATAYFYKDKLVLKGYGKIKDEMHQF